MSWLKSTLAQARNCAPALHETGKVRAKEVPSPGRPWPGPRGAAGSWQLGQLRGARLADYSGSPRRLLTFTLTLTLTLIFTSEASAVK